VLQFASANCAKIFGENHFAEPNRHFLTFLHSNLICRVTYWALLGMLEGAGTRATLKEQGL